MRRYRLDLASSIAGLALTSALIVFFGAAYPQLEKAHSHGFANLWVVGVLALLAIGFALLGFALWPRRLHLTATAVMEGPVEGPKQVFGYRPGTVRLLTLRVTNNRSAAVLTAKVREGVQGLQQNDYGNFELGWDGDSKDVVLDRAHTWKLHLAYLHTDAMQACFVKPDGNPYDALSLKWDHPVRLVVDVTEVESRKRIGFPVEFGFESVPTTNFQGKPARTTRPFLRLRYDDEDDD